MNQSFDAYCYDKRRLRFCPPRQTPIVFNDNMVKALMHKEKFQTRRVIKDQPCDCNPLVAKEMRRDDRWYFALDIESIDKKNTDSWLEESVPCCSKADREFIKSPYGVMNDILWVKEKWAYGEGEYWSNLKYYADISSDHINDEFLHGVDKWNSAASMPKEASRIRLRIYSSYIERLQDITEQAAQAEGAKPSFKDEFDIVHTQPSYRDGFILNIWNAIYNDKNKPEFAWGKNPWVWVINFEVIARYAND